MMNGINPMLSLLPIPLKERLGLLRERFNRPEAYAVSFPKSGRTWLQLMMARVYEQLTALPLEKIVAQHYTTMTEQRSQKVVPIVRFGHGYRYQHFCQNGPFPAWFYNNARIVLLIRDPRDTLVSYYYYQKYHFHSFNGSLHDYVHASGEGRPLEDHGAHCGIAPILRYYNTWIANEHRFRGLLVLNYEDLRSEPARHLRRLCEFIGLDVSDEILRDAIEFASFENMRRMEVNKELRWNALPGSADSNGLKTRRAKVGGYRDELSKEDLAFINSAIAAQLAPCFSQYIHQSAAAA